MNTQDKLLNLNDIFETENDITLDEFNALDSLQVNNVLRIWTKMYTDGLSKNISKEDFNGLIDMCTRRSFAGYTWPTGEIAKQLHFNTFVGQAMLYYLNNIKKIISVAFQNIPFSYSYFKENNIIDEYDLQNFRDVRSSIMLLGAENCSELTFQMCIRNMDNLNRTLNKIIQKLNKN